MDNRLWQSSASASPPASEASPSSGYPTDGNPTTNTPATVPGARWFHALGEEIRSLIVAAGLVPSDTDLTQVAKAVRALIDGTSPMVGSSRNAKMSVATASATATFTADQVIVATVLGGTEYSVPNFNKTINLATTGAGGMDIGAAPVSGYVALYAIYNPTAGTSALMAVNATTAAAPEVYGGANMPSGYTASALVSVWPTNASQQFVIGYQSDRNIYISKASAYSSTTPPTSITGVSISNIVPPNTKNVCGNLTLSSATTANIYGISVYAISQGIGEIAFGAPLAVNESAAAYFSEAISTQQTLYFRNSGTPTSGCTWGISIVGYSF